MEKHAAWKGLASMTLARWSALLCLVCLIAGCSLGGPGPTRGDQPTPELPSRTAQEEPPAQPQEALPLWGPPGLALFPVEETWRTPALYQPITIKGTELLPIKLPLGTFLFEHRGDEVWLHGMMTDNWYHPFPEPTMLHRLPVQVGDRWTIHSPLHRNSFTFAVTAREPVPTPAGEQMALRLDVQLTGETISQEWWVPGYGLVREQKGERIVTMQEVRMEPQPISALGHAAPDHPVLLWWDGKVLRIADLDGEHESFRIEPYDRQNDWVMPFPRQEFYWVDVGEQDLLVNSFTDIGTMRVRYHHAWHFHADRGRFEPVAWISSAGQKERIQGGSGDWTDEGAFDWKGFERYPYPHYIYRFDGEAMRTDPAEEEFIRAKSAEAFVEFELFGWPPLWDEDLIPLFKDPDLGRTFTENRPRPYAHSFPKVEAIPGEANTFRVTVEWNRYLVQVEQGPVDFQVVRFERLTSKP